MHNKGALRGKKHPGVQVFVSFTEYVFPGRLFARKAALVLPDLVDPLECAVSPALHVDTPHLAPPPPYHGLKSGISMECVRTDENWGRMRAGWNCGTRMRI